MVINDPHLVFASQTYTHPLRDHQLTFSHPLVALHSSHSQLLHSPRQQTAFRHIALGEVAPLQAPGPELLAQGQACHSSSILGHPAWAGVAPTPSPLPTQALGASGCRMRLGGARHLPHSKHKTTDQLALCPHEAHRSPCITPPPTDQHSGMAHQAALRVQAVRVCSLVCPPPEHWGPLQAAASHPQSPVQSALRQHQEWAGLGIP